MVELTRERLADLLVDPNEGPDLEIKNWLDLANSNEDKATFAKAALAIANHGGGFIVLGLEAVNQVYGEAPGRPANLDGYSQDLLNGIIHNYGDPPFHCVVNIVASPLGSSFPVVIIPGGHRVPIRAKRAGPNGNTVANNAIYVRKPGPRSEVPQSAQEWDELLARCLRNRRDEMLDQMRDLITGAVPQAPAPTEPERLDAWISASVTRWVQLTSRLPAGVGPRMPHGHYSFAYEITGERKSVPPAQLPDILKASVVRHTGWPPFWYPNRRGIEPYPIDGAIECWLGGDTETPVEERDAASSDFWRISPDGLGYIIRGYDEDTMNGQFGHKSIAPGTVFDLSLPVWRIGEAMLQARALAKNLFDGPTTIRFSITYDGLAGRTLTSIDGRRNMWGGRTAHQEVIILTTHVDSQAIESNLPEIVHPLLSPLYALFDFFELPMQLVVDELARMRAGRS